MNRNPFIVLMTALGAIFGFIVTVDIHVNANNSVLLLGTAIGAIAFAFIALSIEVISDQVMS